MKLIKKILVLALAVTLAMPVFTKPVEAVAAENSPTETSVAGASVTGPTYKYGSTKKPGSKSFTVTVNGTTLKANKDYTLKVTGGDTKAKAAGKYTCTVTITGKGAYTGTTEASVDWYIKKAQSLKTKVPSACNYKKTVLQKDHEHKITVYDDAELTWTSTNEGITVSDGNICIAQGTPKGTYYVTLTAAETDTRFGKTKKIRVRIK